MHSWLLHQVTSTPAVLGSHQQPTVDTGDKPAVAGTLLAVLDSMAETMEGPGQAFSRREFHAITDSMAVLDRGLLDSQVLGTSFDSF